MLELHSEIRTLEKLQQEREDTGTKMVMKVLFVTAETCHSLNAHRQKKASITCHVLTRQNVLQTRSDRTLAPCINIGQIAKA